MNPEKEPLSISISTLVKDGKRLIEFYKPEDHFHVVIKNNSDSSIKLWTEKSSWGFYNLSFEIITPNGEKFIARKKEREWDKNFPDYCSVEPFAYFLLNVNFNDGTWQYPPMHLATSGNVITLSAIFEVPPTKESKELNIWNGKISSRENEYVIWY
ncbi:MAG: hypothetical protein ABI594_02210 [Ginsengibacter sp.]